MKTTFPDNARPGHQGEATTEGAGVRKRFMGSPLLQGVVCGAVVRGPGLWGAVGCSGRGGPPVGPAGRHRTGPKRRCKRPHRETIVLDGQEHELALGIWYANQKQRRNKLTAEQRTALTELGVEWAA
ncbi:helicase associated domain-containing protein [Streptomyces sp. NPDC002540]